MCWHNRLFLLKNNELSRIGHDRFLQLAHVCQFKNFGVWQDSLSCRCKVSHDKLQETDKMFDSLSLLTIFQELDYVRFVQNLRSLILKTEFAPPDILLTILRGCVNLQSLRYYYTLRRVRNEVQPRSASNEKLYHNDNTLVDQVKCRTLQEFSVTVENYRIHEEAQREICYIIHLILKTQRLQKLELNSDQLYLTNEVFQVNGTKAFDQLQELILKGHNISNESLNSILSRSKNLITLQIQNLVLITSNTLANLPASLKVLIIKKCPLIGVESDQVNIPSLPHLNKFTFISKHRTDQVLLHKSEALLLGKLLMASNSETLNDLILNIHARYTINSLFESEDIRKRTQFLKSLCLVNCNLSTFALCNFVLGSAHSDMKLLIASECSNEYPELQNLSLKVLARKCTNLSLRGYTLPHNWLSAFTIDACGIKSLELNRDIIAIEQQSNNLIRNYIGTDEELQETLDETNNDEEELANIFNLKNIIIDTNTNSEGFKCHSVEKLSLISCSSSRMIDIKSIVSVFGNLREFTLINLNPCPIWLIQILSQSCPLLQTLIIRNCTHPVLLSNAIVEEQRLPIAEFKNLKVFELSNCSNPTLQQLCLIIIAMTRVSRFSIQLRLGTQLEVQHTMEGAELLVVMNNCYSGIIGELKRLIHCFLTDNMNKHISFQVYWEWHMFVKIFNQIFNEILEQNDARIRAQMTPLIDNSFDIQNFKTKLDEILNINKAYMVIRNQPERLAMLKEEEQKMIEGKWKEDVKTQYGNEEGLQISIPSFFKCFVFYIMRIIESL
jgi:hypothetical protein